MVRLYELVNSILQNEVTAIFVETAMFQNLTILCSGLGVFWMMFVFAPAIGVAQLVNVALDKPARQSSTRANDHAGKAVDGNRNSDFYGNSCLHTVDELNPFWEVDLGDVYVINKIKIYNRLDCCASRTSDVHTMVSMDSNVFTTVCLHAGQIPDIYTCVPETKTIGRWVRVTIMTPNLEAMNICEVEVMSDQLAGMFKSVRSVKGTGSILERFPVKSNIECANLCYRTKFCRSVNVVTGTASMECELLDSVSNATTVEENVFFWTTYIN